MATCFSDDRSIDEGVHEVFPPHAQELGRAPAEDPGQRVEGDRPQVGKRTEQHGSELPDRGLSGLPSRSVSSMLMYSSASSPMLKTGKGSSPSAPLVVNTPMLSVPRPTIGQ